MKIIGNQKIIIEKNNVVLSLFKESDVDFWEMYIRNQNFGIGFFRVAFDGAIIRANVSGSDIYDAENRNKGYGSLAVQLLANHYGVISSAANGSSSEQAFGMWRKAKAKKEYIKTQYTDYIYILHKNDV